MADPKRNRLIRRLVMTPAVVVGVPLVLIVSPLLLVASLLVDLMTGSRQCSSTRLLTMVLSYLIYEWLGVIVAFPLWVATGFGLFMASKWSRRAHYSVQRWWAVGLFKAVGRCLGALFEIENGDLVATGPIIIAARHASFFDALLPSVLLSRYSDMPARHVLKRELAWDPCLDIYGHRHPNHFVARGSGNSTDPIEALASTAGSEALVIFPEGTFRTATRANRILEKFATREPERAKRLRLSHLLPVRPLGIEALMVGCPDADIVFIAHTGLEPFGSLRTIIANVPFTAPVRVKLWRIPANEIPAEADQRLAVIDQWWQRMDDWVALNHIGNESRPDASKPIRPIGPDPGA